MLSVGQEKKITFWDVCEPQPLELVHVFMYVSIYLYVCMLQYQTKG